MLRTWETEEARYLCLKDDALLHCTLGSTETQVDAARHFNRRSKKTSRSIQGHAGSQASHVWTLKYISWDQAIDTGA